MDRAYLLLNRISANSSNVESNSHIAGLPAITAFTGFAHALERRHFTPHGIQISGTAVLVHRFHLRRGHPKCPAALAQMPPKAGDINSPIVDELKGDGIFSLLLRLDLPEDDSSGDGFGDFLDTPEFDAEQIAAQIARRLPAYPLAGGAIVDSRGVDWLEGPDQVKKRLSGMGDASLLIERNDLLQPPDPDDTAEDGGHDYLDRWLRALALLPDETGHFRRAQKGWIVPLALGYRALEPPQQRADSRTNAAHVYAEPVCGLGECRPLRQILRTDPDSVFHEFSRLAFWRYHHEPQDGLFIVTTQSA